MAAARRDGVTTIRNASPNYMVQDLCFYLELLGVRIDGIGTTTLRVHGLADIDADVEYAVSEDPVEAMSLLTAGIVTGSEITVGRVPIEFMEIELATLAEMGLRYTLSDEYAAANGRTRLVDVTVHPSDLRAPIDKIHPMPFPGLNIDNLPFFAAIAACAQGSTLIHDWVYEGRAIHLTDLTRLGADVRLLDAHRLQVTGPTHWSGAEVSCPPALRPAVVILLAMLAAKGTSVLRDVDIIARGYEQLQDRLVELGRADRDVPRLAPRHRCPAVRGAVTPSRQRSVRAVDGRNGPGLVRPAERTVAAAGRRIDDGRHQPGLAASASNPGQCTSAGATPVRPPPRPVDPPLVAQGGAAGPRDEVQLLVDHGDAQLRPSVSTSRNTPTCDAGVGPGTNSGTSAVPSSVRCARIARSALSAASSSGSRVKVAPAR